eukprot:UN08892
MSVVCNIQHSTTTTQTTSQLTTSPQTQTPFVADGEIFCNQALNITFSDSIAKYYRFILYSAITDIVTFSNCKTKYDTRLSVYNEDLSQEISESYCDGDDCGSCVSDDNNEIFNIPLMSVGLYYIKISPYNSNTNRDGPYVLEIECSTSAPTTNDPTHNPTTATPTEQTLFPTTSQPTSATNNPTRNPTQFPSPSPTIFDDDQSKDGPFLKIIISIIFTIVFLLSQL